MLMYYCIDARSYVPPVQIDEIMRGSAIGVIKASKSSEFPVGSYAIANIGWTELAIAKEKHLEKIEVPSNGKVTDALGVLGKKHAFDGASAIG
jgi:NADPH-dependent curcumin reductase CurA